MPVHTQGSFRYLLVSSLPPTHLAHAHAGANNKTQFLLKMAKKLGLGTPSCCRIVLLMKAPSFQDLLLPGNCLSLFILLKANSQVRDVLPRGTIFYLKPTIGLSRLQVRSGFLIIIQTYQALGARQSLLHQVLLPQPRLVRTPLGQAQRDRSHVDLTLRTALI